ncbi:hypothetical protein NU195Hw_g2331t1 [Hortaea werneckii]
MFSYGIVLAILLVTVYGQAINQPRAVSFTNSSITTSSSQRPTITRTITRTHHTGDTPPCCWVYGGSYAIRVNSWWSSTWSVPVATEVRTVLSYPNSVVVANTTTVTAHEIKASIEAWRRKLDTDLNTLHVSTDAIPSDLVNSTFLSEAASYGRSTLHLGTTAVSWAPDRQIGIGTDFLVWRAGIETYYPRVNATGGASLTKYEPEMCGTYTDYIYHAMRSGTWATYNTSLLLPTHFPVTSGPFGDLPVYRGGYWGLDIIPSDVTYVQELSTTVPYMTRQVLMNVPSEMMQWMAQEPSIIEEHPYIANCWTLPGVGQPTVHIPVAWATVTSSHIITMEGSIQPEPSSTENTAPQTKPLTPIATPGPTFESVSSDAESSLANVDGTPRTFDSTSTSAGLSSVQSSPSPQAAISTSDQSSDTIDPVNESPAGQSQAPTAALPNDSVTESPSETSVITSESPSVNAEVLPTAISDKERSDVPSDTQMRSETPPDQSQAAATTSPKSGGGADLSLNIPNTEDEVPSTRPQVATTATADIDAPSTHASIQTESIAVAFEASGDGTTATAATSFVEDNNQAFGASENQEPGQAETTTAIDGETEPVSKITIGSGITGFTPIGDLSAIVGSQTLSVGGPAATEAGHVLRLTSANKGLGLVIASAVEPSFPPAQGIATITANGSPYVASRVGSSAFVVGTQVVLPGSAVSVGSIAFSIESGRLLVGSGPSAETFARFENIATAESATPVSGPDALDVDQDATKSVVVIAGVTLLPDEMATIGGQSMALIENNIVVASGTSTSTLALPSNTPFNEDQQLVIDAQTFTVASAASGGVVIAGASILPGSAVAVSGRTFSLTGGALVIASQGSGTTATLAPASLEPFDVTFGDQVFTAVYEPVATAQSKTLYSDVTTVMVARPTSSASGEPADVSQSATTRPDFGAIIMSGLGVAADASVQVTQSEGRTEQGAETSLDLSSTSDSTSAPFRTEQMPTSSPNSDISEADTSGSPSASPSSGASSDWDMSLGLMVAAALMLLTVATL